MRRFPLLALGLVGFAVSLAACASPTESDDGEDVGAGDAAVITQTERTLVGAYQRSDTATPVLGLYMKHPTRNYAFEKKVVVTLDLDASKFPGLCPSGQSTCMEARVEAELRATATRLTLKNTRPSQTWPQAASIFGTYTYTRTSSSFELRKVSAPAVVWRLDKAASYCGQTYDCNFQRPDDNCTIEYACTSQRTCEVKTPDVGCDGTWRSVADLGDIAGTWTSPGSAPGSYASLELVETPVTRATTSSGSFRGTRAGGQSETGEFSAMPENPAIGFASLTFVKGTAIEAILVKGVRLGPTGRVSAMQVQRLAGMGPVGPVWTYARP